MRINVTGKRGIEKYYKRARETKINTKIHFVYEHGDVEGLAVKVAWISWRVCHFDEVRLGETYEMELSDNTVVRFVPSTASFESPDVRDIASEICGHRVTEAAIHGVYPSFIQDDVTGEIRKASTLYISFADPEVAGQATRPVLVDNELAPLGGFCQGQQLFIEERNGEVIKVDLLAADQKGGG